MNSNKLTQKSMEAINSAQSLAIEYENQQLQPIHLLSALLSQNDGLIPELMKKLSVNLDAMQSAALQKVSALPHVSGQGREADKIYISADTDK
ncbi:MAG: Clp protease N-terminal domain-containing protein, partial [Oscillospiraceae bacterium]